MKQYLRHTYGVFSLLLATVLLGGCGSAPLIVEPIAPGQDPKVLIEQQGQQFEQASGSQLELLSPDWFRKARASYTKAREQLEKGAPEQELLTTIAAARAELQQAEVVAVRSRDQLAEVIESRNAAMAANAAELGDEFAAVENDFLDLTRAIENDRYEYARRMRQRVAEGYRSLESRAVEQSMLGEVHEVLQQARQDKLHQLVPKSFQEAEAALKEAQAHIAAQPQDRQGITEKSAGARFLAQRALVIADTERLLTHMSPEDRALWMESFLFQTTTRLKTQDRRDLPFEQQLGAIMAGVDALRSEATLARRSDEEKTALIQRMNDRMAEVEGRAQRFRQEQQRLSVENRLNEQFFQVQSLFQPHEAVVIRQPDQMVIWLTGLRFPVGGVAVQAAAHGLLRKVQQAILLFGAREVIVQGHTDSSGDARNNFALSSKRAEAVMQFLAAGIDVPMLRISAAGHGAELPIASNESAEGKALNRRIEVVIKP